MSNAVQGIFCGPSLGVFLLGMVSPRANHQGALCGYASAVALLLYCVGGAAYCDSYRGPTGAAPACSDGGALRASAVSEWWYGAIGCIASGGVGYLSSFCWEPPPMKQLLGLNRCHPPADKLDTEPLVDVAVTTMRLEGGGEDT
jgi:Na+/proline symporter